MTCREVMTSPEAQSRLSACWQPRVVSVRRGLSVTPEVYNVEVCRGLLPNVQIPADTVGDTMSDGDLGYQFD